jgi:hypothetical protein
MKVTVQKSPDMSLVTALGLSLEVLHEWCFKPAGEERDRELGNRIWSILCGLNQSKIITEKDLQWAREVLSKHLQEQRKNNGDKDF